jgi:hypothetical protein
MNRINHKDTEMNRQGEGETRRQGKFEVPFLLISLSFVHPSSMWLIPLL